MKKKLFIFVYLLPLLLFSQVEMIDKLQFQNSDFSQLNSLNKDLKNVRIVGLGESRHYMGETYTSKIKMVKYLHEQCGFDVLAFESPMYDLSKFSEIIPQNDSLKPQNFKNFISGVWVTDDMNELFEYILETQKTDRPLIYYGFDESLFYGNKNYNIVTDFNTFVNELNKFTNSNIELDSVFNYGLDFTAQKCYYFSKLKPKDTLIMHNKIEEIKSSLNKIADKNNYYKFWERMTYNIQSIYRKNYKTSNRDFEMAQNVSFIAKDLFPNKKIILWAATMHLLENIKDVEKFNKYDETYTMGHFLKNEFHNQYFHIAFTTGNGVTGIKGYMGLGKKKFKSPKSSIEYFIETQYNCDYAFISTKSKETKEIINKNGLVKSNIMGGNSYKMNLSNVVDAIFYFKEERIVEFNLIEFY